jgi:membrane-bound lytic murein transglycosylase B
MTLFRRSALLLIVLTQAIACASSPQASTGSLVPELKKLVPETTETPIEFTDARLKADGLSDEFIHSVHTLFLDKNSKWPESVTRIVELNVFGFLGQSNYALHDSPLAQRKIKRYLKDHQKSFRTTRKKYAVSSSAIASLLWVETKHGKTMGSFPIAWVYYALVMGSHPDFVRTMVELTPEKLAKGNPKELTLRAAQEKVIERCKSKATWALEELKAIQQIQKENYFNPFNHKASFAGAFGIPQFIPSTYLKSAVSDFRAKPDLFKHSDAILSVAHFLQTNGWKEKDPEAEATALFSYNRSKDYGAVILKLAQEVSPATRTRKSEPAQESVPVKEVAPSQVPTNSTKPTRTKTKTTPPSKSKTITAPNTGLKSTTTSQ